MSDCVCCPKCLHEVESPCLPSQNQQYPLTCASCGFEMLIEVEWQPNYSVQCRDHRWSDPVGMVDFANCTLTCYRNCQTCGHVSSPSLDRGYRADQSFLPGERAACRMNSQLTFVGTVERVGPDYVDLLVLPSDWPARWGDWRAWRERVDQQCRVHAMPVLLVPVQSAPPAVEREVNDS